MADGYTEEEVRAVVERLVRGSIRRPHDALGTRKLDVTFDDTREAAAGAFLHSPGAPYAVVELGRRAALNEVSGLTTAAQQVLTALRVLRRRVLPVSDLTTVANARSALVELEGGAARVRDVTKVASFVRFNANVPQFLKKAGGAVKDTGQIVPTPSEARGRLPELLATLQERAALLVEKAELLASAVDDYARLNLPQLALGTVVSESRKLLTERLADLEGRTPEGRLEVLRQTVLEVLAVRGVIKKYGSFSAQASAYDLAGTGALFADADRPAEVAALEAEKYGPYTLIAGIDVETSSNVLRLYLDTPSGPPATPTATVFLPPSLVPKIEGLNPGPYQIDAGVNDLLNLEVDGGPFPALVGDGLRSAASIAADLTSELSGSGVVGEAYFSPLMYDGSALVQAGNVLRPPFGLFPPSSVEVGDEVDFYSGPNAPATRTVTAVALDFSTITVGGAALTLAPDPNDPARIRYGKASRKVRLIAASPAFAVANRTKLQLRQPTEVHRALGITLGMYGELVAQGRPTDAALLADALTKSGFPVSAEAYLAEPVELTLRTDAANATRLSVYLHRGEMSWVTFVGTTRSFTAIDPLAAGVLPGHRVAVRSGANAGAQGIVLSVSATGFTAFFATLAPGSGTVEVGPSVLAAGRLIEVSEGPNARTYDVESAPDPLTAVLRQVVPFFRDSFNQPVVMSGRVGKQGLRFKSKKVLLSGSVEVHDPLLVFFTGATGNRAVPSTRYLQLPGNASGVEEGDFFDLHLTKAEAPDKIFTIVRLLGGGLVELDAALDAPLSISFGTASLPFGRVRSRRVASYDDFADALSAWAAPWKDGGLERFFKNLARFINPLLANKNPTDADVGLAENEVRALYAAFSSSGATEFGVPGASLEDVLGSYEGPSAPVVDSLFRGLREKGADRAVDLLTEGRFTTFFGLDVDDVSYAGTMQKAAREVLRNDLPVRKTDRAQAVRSRLKASVASPDFEYSSDDLDGAPLPDPPGDLG